MTESGIMPQDPETHQGTGDKPRRGIHWWVRRFFFAWAILSTLWVANKMRTRGVSAETLRTSPAVAVSDGPTILEFRPARVKGTSALIFFCDLSALRMPVTKIYATNDGVAPYDRIQATKHLLPAHTRWVEIRGGNHSQFGHYGHQLLDGKPAITRAAQQAMTRSAILDALAESDVED